MSNLPAPQTPRDSAREFALRPLWIKQRRRLVLMKLSILMGTFMLVLGTIVAIQIFAYGRRDLIPVGLIICLMPPVIVVFQLRQQTRRLHRISQSFRIVLQNGVITRHVEGIPDVQISRQQVTRIDVFPTGDLLIRTDSPQIILAVPRDLEAFEVLESELKTWGQFHPAQKRTGARLLIPAIFILACVAVWLNFNPWVTVILDPPLITILIWSAVKLLKSPHVDRQTKLIAWMLVLPLISLIGVLIMVIVQLMHRS